MKDAVEGVPAPSAKLAGSLLFAQLPTSPRVSRSDSRPEGQTGPPPTARATPALFCNSQNGSVAYSGQRASVIEFSSPGKSAAARDQTSAVHSSGGDVLRVSVLGSGTSMGVPTPGCHCAVCKSSDPRDNRTRPSILLSYSGHNVLVDTTPDFRFQALRANLEHLDAVLFTHSHADHIMGLDDIRPYNLKQRCAIPIFASGDTLAVLRRTFAYVFEEAPPGSTVPLVELREITGPFDIFGLRIQPVPALHGPSPVLGFRAGAFAYLTDFSSVPPESKLLLAGLDHFVLDALRYTPHPMHSNVEQSMALVDELRPRQAWFTHICHDLGHQAANDRLPENVRLAYDGLTLEVDL
jgi:phosphoribosyl 1,2-cyclic phosphate phosphodiesterase